MSVLLKCSDTPSLLFELLHLNSHPSWTRQWERNAKFMPHVIYLLCYLVSYLETAGISFFNKGIEPIYPELFQCKLHLTIHEDDATQSISVISSLKFQVTANPI